jgi:hypothetical protein
MIGTEAFGVKHKGQFQPSFPPGLYELVHVPLVRQKELQEADSFILAGLVDTEIPAWSTPAGVAVEHSWAMPSEGRGHHRRQEATSKVAVAGALLGGDAVADECPFLLSDALGVSQPGIMTRRRNDWCWGDDTASTIVVRERSDELPVRRNKK